jgi:hypothetical protein
MVVANLSGDSHPSGEFPPRAGRRTTPAHSPKVAWYAVASMSPSTADGSAGTTS